MATAEDELVTPKLGEASLNSLTRDYRLYPRANVDYITVGRFMDAMKAGAKFPPITVCAKTGKIIDGFHRYAAYSELGVQMIDVLGVEVKDDSDFFLRAVEANKAHGLGYTGGDHEKIIKIARLLKLEREKVALAMAIPVQKLADLQRSVPVTHDEPVKVGTQHRARSVNRMDSPPQHDKQRTSTPTGYFFFFNQVIQFLKSGACDLTNSEVSYKVRELAEAIQKRINPEGKQLTPLVLPLPVKSYLESWAEREGKSMVNLVVEQLTMNVEIEVDNEKCAGTLSKAQAEDWVKRLKPYSMLNKSS